MKKLALLLLATSTMLAGCAPSYVRNDVKGLADDELCSRIGYAQVSGNMEAFKGGYIELTNRKIHTIATEDCIAFASMGASQALDDRRTTEAITQEMNQQQVRQRLDELNARTMAPVTTSCSNNLMGFSCVTN